MSPRSLTFHVSSLNGFALDGVARGRVGLDYSAGASVSVDNGVPVLHRLILDRTHNLYFGYDLVVTPAAQPGRVEMHFHPLSELAGFHAQFDSFGRGVMTLPDDRTVDIGVPTAVPLEVNGSDATTLIDTLTFTPAR